MLILWRKAIKNDDYVSIAGIDNDNELDRNTGIGEKIGKKENLLLNLLSTNPNLTISKLAHASGMAPSTVQVYLDKLRAEGKIRRIGPDKGGYWEVI